MRRGLIEVTPMPNHCVMSGPYWGRTRFESRPETWGSR